MIKRVFGICGLVLCGMASANAAVLLQYDFEAAHGTSAFNVDPSLQTPGAFSPTVVSGSIATHAGSQAFNTTAWQTGAGIDVNNYVSFTLTPVNGSRVDITSISFRIDRDDGPGSADAPDRVQVAVFRGATSLYDSGAITVDTTINSFETVNLIGIASVANETATLSVRFYAWNQVDGHQNASVFFDDITLSGGVTPVPEPVNFALGLFSVLALGVTVGRRVLASRKA